MTQIVNSIMLERVKCELVGYLDPGRDIADIARNSYTSRPDIYKGMVKTLLPSGYEAKRMAGKRTGNNVIGRL